MDPDILAALLHAAASEGESVTYSEALAALGHRFTRPKMRALCVMLDDLDTAERGAGRPPLAVLVVRQSDRLPGQGWWLGQRDYTGEFTGPEAATWVRARQAEVFAAWTQSSASRIAQRRSPGKPRATSSASNAASRASPASTKPSRA